MPQPLLHIGLLAPDLTHRHGWAHYASSLLAALARAGARLTVLCAANTPAEALAAYPAGEPVRVLPVLPALDPMARAWLPALAGRWPRARALLAPAQLVHALAEPYAPLAAALAGERPLYVTGHGSYVRVRDAWRPPTRPVMAWAMRRAHLVCVSHYTERVARQALPGVRTHVIANGVDPERFAAAHELPREPATIISVGAVKPRKGTLQLVQAMPTVRAHVPEARLVIIGSLALDPPYVARVRQAIAAHGLERAVLLTDRIEDAALRAWYARATLFALPSINAGWRFEGFGLALLEASAAGLPVIGSRGCGAEDAVREGETGLLIDQHDAAASLAQAIVALLRDPARARRMGEAGRTFAAAHTWDATARALLALYAAG
jgi:phosphatidylinositol alpha-1,6-mannosyltransferase